MSVSFRERRTWHTIPVSVRSLTGWWGAVLEAPDARSLARFYSELLGWSMASEEPSFATVAPGNGVAYIGFQTSPKYVPPVWPPEDGRQQMMMHLDVGVGDVEAAVADAVEIGARLADFQPQDTVRVMLDPVGHPFCLYLDVE
jgi:predicted enzyme related to lactoylglutathione lyase